MPTHKLHMSTYASSQQHISCCHSSFD